MNISTKWLSQWVNLDGIDTDALAHRLTMVGLEHEGTVHIGAGGEGIVVGQIESIEPHPKADRLVVCKVNVGGESLSQIVCGATNMKAGDRVPVAQPGSQPPAFDFVIGERKMRGVLSQGMLCSEEELGLDRKSEGLFILPADLPLGAPIFEALAVHDTILELGLTPNRPDCLSHMGVAREVATIYDRPMQSVALDEAPAWESTTHVSIETLAGLDVQDGEGCPVYGMAVVEGIKVGPSPLWLKLALGSIGVRSINNVVDVTNYVMMDLGQPLHAFDLDRLAEHRIIVRRATEGEAFTGIDHKAYELTAQDLVIADPSGPVAIAGVMGSEGSEVHDGTTRVLIECAYFNPTTVRKSAKRHGLHTDASHRFERGIDPNAIERNLQRAVALLLQTQEGSPKVASGVIVSRAMDFEPVTIHMPTAMPNRILGTSLDDEQVVRILSGLGMEVVVDGASLAVTVPSYRPDLERPIDLVEEVARIVGFDEIPSTLPASIMGANHEVRDDAKHAPTLPGALHRGRVNGITDLLLGQGLAQVVNYSFMGSAELEQLQLPETHLFWNAVEVANPMNAEQEMMRTTLLPGLLRNLKHNWSQRQRDVALFEIGRCYSPEQERVAVGMILTGRRSTHWSGTQSWDFYDVKALVEAIGRVVGLRASQWQVPEQTASYLHPGVQAQWIGPNGVLGHVGQLHPVIAQQEGYDQPVLWACVWMDALTAHDVYVPQFEALARYPSVTRDYALLQDTTGQYAQIEEALRTLVETDEQMAGLLKSYTVFDVYEGEHIEEGKRSVALQVVYQPTEQTLTEEEITSLSQRLMAHLEENANVKWRE